MGGKIFGVGQRAISKRISSNKILSLELSSKTNISTVNELLEGKKQSEIANNYGITQGRISQIWGDFQNELLEKYNNGIPKQILIEEQVGKGINLKEESLNENVHRENLQPLERAKFLKRIAVMEKIYHTKDGSGAVKYKKGDINSAELARRVGMPQDVVSNDLILLRMGLREIKEGSVKKLIRINSVENKEDKKKLLKKVENKPLHEISKVYEVGRGGDRKTNNFKEPNLGSLPNDVLTKTATETGVSKNTIQRARAYVKAVNKEPEKYKSGEKPNLSSSPNDILTKNSDGNPKINRPNSALFVY